MTQIKQINDANTFGFEHKSDTDFGVDESGATALGYQHHDALWWNESDIVETHRPETLDLGHTVQHFHGLFSKIAFNVVNAFDPETMLDLGCGSGLLAQYIRKFNRAITTVTVDANRLVGEKSPYIDHNHFTARTDQNLDFRDEQNNKMTFDVVISLEHFEHVPPETFDILMDNIVEHTHAGSYLIFTAALWEYDEEDQKHVHCHIKSEEEWIKYVESYGFEILPMPFRLERAGDTVEILARRTLSFEAATRRPGVW